MRSLFFIFGLILALIAASFLPQVKDFRTEKASVHFEQGNLKAAKRWYFLGKLQGDVQAANNYHVLDYREIRYNENASKEKKSDNYVKATRAFEKLAQKGSVPAAYNAGMFYYKSSFNSANYIKGLNYFDLAAASGDEMSRHAADMMRARSFTVTLAGSDNARRRSAIKRAREKRNEKIYREYKKSADAGNGFAAYKFAQTTRFDEKKLRAAEKYARMGAETGYADAQNFLGEYYPKRKDSQAWLEKAAMNPHNRSLRAASELAMRAEKRRDHRTRRKWLELASTPRGPFHYHIIAESGVLRWRGLQNTINADANNTKEAAYELALMQLDGIGGAVDKAGAIKNLEYADDWDDAALLLAEVKSGRKIADKNTSDRSSQRLLQENLKKIDSQKHRPYYSKLRPLVANKQIRYATQTDVKKYAQGVSTIYSNEKTGFRTWGKVKDCLRSGSCFYIDRPIILPADMFGAHSATFIVDPAVILPKQHLSHNKYIFMNELQIPK